MSLQNTSLQKTKTKKTPDSEGRSRSWRCSRHPVASGVDSGSGRSLGAPVRSQDRSERGTSHQGSRFSRPAFIHSPRDAAAPSARGVERSSPADGYATRLGTWQTPGRRPRLQSPLVHLLAFLPRRTWTTPPRAAGRQERHGAWRPQPGHLRQARSTGRDTAPAAPSPPRSWRTTERPRSANPTCKM